MFSERMMDSNLHTENSINQEENTAAKSTVVTGAEDVLSTKQSS